MHLFKYHQPNSTSNISGPRSTLNLIPLNPKSQYLKPETLNHKYIYISNYLFNFISMFIFICMLIFIYNIYIYIYIYVCFSFNFEVLGLRV